MSSTVSSPTQARACCENGRPIMTDPHTGQTICSCQYGTALLNYSRVQGIPEEMYGASAAAAYAAGATQGYVPLATEGSAFCSPLRTPAFDIKEGSDAWRALAAQSGGCFPYDPSLAIYPYGSGYAGLDLNARRKNATRETTNTLKAWLYEHRKNPYPTKGEKIMLAIITKMTLTQVSTWFANARRRLKKENKMTWSPRNRSEDGDDIDNDNDDDLESSKENANITNTSHDSALNVSPRTRDDHTGEADPALRTEKIISVDEDESDHSDAGDISDTEEHETDRLRLGDAKDSNSNTSASQVGGDDRKDLNAKVLNDLHDSHTQPVSDGEAQPRPKIWSITDFLGNSKEGRSSQTSKSPDTPAIVCSRQTNKLSYLNFSQSSEGIRVPNGHAQFSVGLPGLPLSLNQTTLSYPYTLSSATQNKSDSNMQHTPSSLRATEQALKEELFKKAARMQNGIFSPARQLDDIRVGKKMVL